MKKLTIRKIIEIIFCCMAILGSCGILKPAFSDSVYGGIAAIGIILANLGLITLAIFRKGYGYHKLLLALEFLAFCFLVYFSTSFLDNSENIFTQLLIFGGFCS